MHLAVVPTKGFTNLHTSPFSAATARNIAHARNKAASAAVFNAAFMAQLYGSRAYKAIKKTIADTITDTIKDCRQG